ncbi:6070_t:CDS:2 [Paraglomus brasilianum]|uniref:6070_t:CDS:1 n=1 Tax=Paraglomus brasilianum TaxID=144538 RepID=A0A9N9BCJ8_9GLOM|nr:6070_t:CDS:2 [Paraglomus brasilianum]
MAAELLNAQPTNYTPSTRPSGEPLNSEPFESLMKLLVAAAAAANNHTQINKRAHSIFATGVERPWPGARLPYKYVDIAAMNPFL